MENANVIGSVLSSNIEYLLQKNVMKVGELENRLGLSAGYISRIDKSEKFNPNFNFIKKISDFFKVDIDTLININLADLSSTEEYFLRVITKLLNDTMQDKIIWDKETADDLSIDPDEFSHPVFRWTTYFQVVDNEQVQYKDYLFKSNLFAYETRFIGNSYNLRLKNGNYLYLMSIKHRTEDKKAIEIWMANNDNTISFLVGNYNEKIGNKIDLLYSNIIEADDRPKVTAAQKYVLDSYLDNDLSDDTFHFSEQEDVDVNKIPF